MISKTQVLFQKHLDNTVRNFEPDWASIPECQIGDGALVIMLVGLALMVLELGLTDPAQVLQPIHCSGSNSAMSCCWGFQLCQIISEGEWTQMLDLS